MYRTKICDKCDNNKFLVIPDGISFKVQCSKCHDIREVFELDGKMIIDKCPNCSSSLFKFREKVNDNTIETDFVCSECGERASYFYIDDNGNEVTLEKRTLLDMKKFLGTINDRLYNIEYGINCFKAPEHEFIDPHELNKVISSINNELTAIKNGVEDLDIRIKKLEL